MFRVAPATPATPLAALAPNLPNAVPSPSLSVIVSFGFALAKDACAALLAPAAAFV